MTTDEEVTELSPAEPDSGESPLDEVADAMIDRGCGSVIVTEDGTIRGIFTSTDALYALAVMLRRAAA